MLYLFIQRFRKLMALTTVEFAESFFKVSYVDICLKAIYQFNIVPMYISIWIYQNYFLFLFLTIWQLNNNLSFF